MAILIPAKQDTGAIQILFPSSWNPPKWEQMPREISEEITRKEMIDPQLEKAGWYLADHSKVKTEIPVDGYDAELWNGVSDYTVYRETGDVLAVVEAKRTTHAARPAEGRDQARQIIHPGFSCQISCVIPE